MPGDVMQRLRFGAAFYTEYSPYERLEKDLDLMAEASFSVIRVGESVWATWEPREGVFELDWLQPVLDGAHQRNIGVVLGTPTYAIPPWLHRTYPEVMAERRTGEPIAFGARQNVDYSHPAFRHLAERVVRRIVARYADHPAVIGYQVDNEPGLESFHNHASFERFVERLRERYRDVDALNERWGLTYWSHRLSRWADLWTPDGNTTPAYDLAWRRYQADLTREFIHWQAEIVREYARPDQFVTTCLALGRPSQDVVDVGAGLDVTAANLYYAMQDGLQLPASDDRQVGRPFWLEGAGLWWLHLLADTTRGVRQEPFLVTETNASSISGSFENHGGYDGQWRQAIWTMVGRGARMVEYWHWHTNHFGAETYWGGVLGHSLEPGRCYQELARTGTELRRLEPLLQDYRADEEVAFLVSPESRWALEFQPPLTVEGGREPDRSAYDRILHRLYRGFFEARTQCAVVQPQQLGDDVSELVQRWPVLVAPALYVASDALLELLAAYARAGGHLVLTFRSGYTDLDARPRTEVMPGVLAGPVGATYLEYTNLAGPVPVRVDERLGGVVGASATAWADALVAEQARPLVTYDHPHLARWPAVTTNDHGAGRVTYLGTLPDGDLMRSLARWVATTSLPSDPWRDLHESVTAASGVVGAGRLRVVANWSWQGIRVPVPATVDDLLDERSLPAGGTLGLGPWDVRLLLERDST
jgi:beta-galactosidase